MSESYHHGDLQRALLLTAKKILQAEGWEQVTFRRLAREIGVSHNAPYRHFKNRKALFAALSHQAIEELRDQLHSAMGQHPDDVQEQIRAFGVSYLTFALENPQRYRLMFNRDFMQVDEAGDYPELVEIFDNAAWTLIAIFERGQAAGQIKGDAAQTQALAYWSLLHGFALLWLDEQITLPFHATDTRAADSLQMALDALLHGLGV